MKNILKTTFIFILILIFAACQAEPTPETETAAVTSAEQTAPAGSPEAVRDEVIDYLETQHGDDLSGLLEDITWAKLPEPEVSSVAVYGYQSERWRMTMTVLPAGLIEIDGETLEEDTFAVELTLLTAPPFTRWNGYYAEAAGVTEESFVNNPEAQEKITSEQARDLAYDLIIQKYPSAQISEAPNWTLFGNQENLGQEVYVYQDGEYTATVNWSEYAGAFSVIGYYEEVGDQYVEIEWNVRVSADGSDLTEEGYQYFGGE